MQFEIIVQLDGTFWLEAQGYSGPVCLADAAKLIELIGSVEATEIKPEYYAENSADIAQQIQIGDNAI